MQALLTVSEAGSYRAAAKTVSLNTLRKRVAELERKIGLPLLTASVSGIAPTDTGVKIIETAKAMRTALERGLVADCGISLTTIPHEHALWHIAVSGKLAATDL